MRINEIPIALTHSKCYAEAEPILGLIYSTLSSFRSYAVVPASRVSVNFVLITGFQRENAN